MKKTGFLYHLTNISNYLLSEDYKHLRFYEITFFSLKIITGVQFIASHEFNSLVLLLLGCCHSSMWCKGGVKAFGGGNLALSWQAMATSDAGVVRDGWLRGYGDSSDCRLQDSSESASGGGAVGTALPASPVPPPHPVSMFGKRHLALQGIVYVSASIN